MAAVLIVTRQSRWHPSLRSWANRWSLRSGQWLKNGQNATSPITSYLSKERSLRSSEYNAIYFCPPTNQFWGSKVKNIFVRKNCHFSLGYFFTPMTLFRLIWMKNWCWIQNQRTKLPLGAQTPEKWHITSWKVIDLWWSRLTSERSQCVYHGCHLATPIDVHITSKNTEVRKFQALKRYGTQVSLGMTLEIRSQVKGHSRYGLKFLGKM